MKKKQANFIRNLLIKKNNKIVELEKLLQEQAIAYDMELKKKIFYYENILELMPGHVYWLDKNNVYLGCNATQAQHAQLNSRLEIVGKKNNDLPWRGEEADELDKINLEVMQHGIAKSKVETATMINGPGVYFSQKVPLRDESGIVVGMLGISIDITELKNTEKALIAAKERAEAASQSKVEFIANMSHDIRTPLNGVIGMSRLLQDQLHNPQQKQFASWITESGEQLLSLLNNILDIVSAENVTDDDIRQDTFNLRSYIDDLVQLERPMTILKNIEFHVEIDEQVPEFVVADRVKLHRILLNLLGNAIKFTQAGYILMEIKFVDTDHEKPYLQFQVIDTGIGISDEHKDKVFERFFRGSSSYSGVYSGYGVGLHIAQSYVRLLGGELKFVSQPGMGTTFYFDMPIVLPADNPLIDDLKMSENSTLNGVDQTNALRLLLVEDNIIALRMLEVLVTQLNCSYQSALSGAEAFQCIQAKEFDIMITDIGLPDFSGYELSKQIRQWEIQHQKKTMPIIALTAHLNAKTQCLEAGMNDVFSKPLSLQNLKSILLKYCSYQNKLRDLKEERTGLPDTDKQLFELEAFSVLDLDYALQRIKNKEALLDMLEQLATQLIPTEKSNLLAAKSKDDWKTIETKAHHLKGSAVYCGTFKMQYANQYLECYCKMKLNADSGIREKLYYQLLDVLDETQTVILTLLFSNKR